MNKKTKRRLIILGGLALLTIGYFFFELFNYSYNIIRLNNLKAVLEDDLYVLKEKEASLKIDYTKLQDPEYIARYARENYLYSKDGEYIIQINKKEDEQLEETTSQNYLVYYTVAAGIVTLAIIIKMNITRKAKHKKRTK